MFKDLPAISEANGLNDSNHIKIALTGKMRSGKDTVARTIAEIIRRNTNYDVLIFSFGDSLKLFANFIFPHEFRENEKPRELYQWLGQTLRQRDEDIWIRHIIKEMNNNIKEISAYKGKKIISIITDLRQPNEYEFCKQNGFHIIKVECDDAVRLERMKESNDNFKREDLNHETERHIDLFEADYTLTTTHINEKELKERVREVLKSILNKYILNEY